MAPASMPVSSKSFTAAEIPLEVEADLWSVALGVILDIERSHCFKACDLEYITLIDAAVAEGEDVRREWTIGIVIVEINSRLSCSGRFERVSVTGPEVVFVVGTIATILDEGEDEERIERASCIVVVG
mmetsp:Transcript_16528/g.34107  ORF Transcript_16528/g.34107 Transcript_16528/m.34107 type:complete len:128 (+) Transcript_16528:141-524(+)